MSDVTGRFRELDRIRAPELWPDIQGRDPRQGEPEPLKRGLAIVLAFAVAAAGVGLAARALLSSNGISAPVVPITPKANGKIAFACGDPTYLGGANLCVIEPDGTGLIRLAEGFQVTAPSWSPDGTRILFQQGGGIDSGEASISIMNADGSGGSTLIQRDEFPAYDRFPDWSPDGQRLAFSRSVYDDGSYVGEYIAVARADGTEVTQLTDQAGTHWMPDWSPDGTVIAYIADRAPHEGDFDLFTARLSDSTITRLTETAQSSERSPSWSPDGSAIAFVRDNIGQDQIVVVRKDGSNQRVLFACRDDCSRLTSVAWAPDGTELVFAAADAQSVSQLFLINLDGSDVRQLTTSPGGASSPAWQPVPIEETTDPSPAPSWSVESEASSPGASRGSADIGTIAFTNERSTSVFVLEVPGEAVQIGEGLDPAWSPDGSHLAVMKSQGEATEEIVVMNTDGSGATTIVHLPTSPGTEIYGGGPTWSPDGMAVSFTVPRGLYRVGIDGTGLNLIVEPGSIRAGCSLRDAAWSPVGSLIAFDVDCEGGHEGIWVIAPDGSGLRRIGPRPQTTETYSHPSWSPDGTQLAFEHEGSGFSYIALMSTDGTGFRELRGGSDGHDRQPSWTPDGSRIVFSDGSLDHEFARISVMGVDGSNRTVVVGMIGDAGEPAVRPSG